MFDKPTRADVLSLAVGMDHFAPCYTDTGETRLDILFRDVSFARLFVQGCMSRSYHGQMDIYANHKNPALIHVLMDESI